MTGARALKFGALSRARGAHVVWDSPIVIEQKLRPQNKIFPGSRRVFSKKSSFSASKIGFRVCCVLTCVCVIQNDNHLIKFSGKNGFSIKMLSHAVELLML